MPPTLYLVKANNNVLSHCACAHAPITSSPQMDCPWCGCGWLFTCIACRKAFTFARCVEVDQSLEDLARRDLRGGGFSDSDESIAAWVAEMTAFLDGAEPGEEYVILDLVRIPVAHTGRLTIPGAYADHDLHYVPQVRALTEPAVLDATLGAETYWREHRYEGDDE
jgi:hypothetical protein